MIALLSMGVLWLAPQGSGAFDPPQVHVQSEAGQEWWSVQARNVSPATILSRIAELSARSVEGMALLEEAPLVTVDLRDRPLDQVLEYSLGSVGLRAELRRDAVSVLPDVESLEDPELLLEVASAAWLKATTLFPNHPRASAARLFQGELAELRGLEQVALRIYAGLIEDRPNAPEADEASMRAGRVAFRMGLYTDAAEYFRRLATSSDETYRAASRLELARTMIELGDPQMALHMLQALDEGYPPLDVTERTARALVRARAYEAVGKPMQALRELDGFDEDFDPLGAWEALAIRARALEAMNLEGEAARAWLAYSRDATGEDKELALERAARLALASGDELGTLFACREAQRLGIHEGFPELQREARRRLGFAIAGDPTGSGIDERIEQGEALIQQGTWDEAERIFEDLFPARRSLAEPESARVTAGWAACVDHRRGVEAAVAILSAERPRFRTTEARRVLDLAAARLFERAGLAARAADAYQGIY